MVDRCLQITPRVVAVFIHLGWRVDVSCEAAVLLLCAKVYLLGLALRCFLVGVFYLIFSLGSMSVVSPHYGGKNASATQRSCRCFAFLPPLGGSRQ